MALDIEELQAQMEEVAAVLTSGVDPLPDLAAMIDKWAMAVAALAQPEPPEWQKTITSALNAAQSFHPEHE